MFFPEEGAMMPQPKPRGGMFGGKAQDVIMAALAGYMSRQNPQMASALMGMMQQKRQQALEEQQYQRHRQDGREDWLWKKEHEGPDYGQFGEEMMQAGINPGTPEWVANMAAKVQNTVNPVVWTPMGPVLRSMVTSSMAPPTQPVGSLTPIPDDGGPTPPASGGFPGY